MDATAKTEAAAAGGDVLPVVLPSTQNLTGPFNPASDSDWLTIGDVTSGVVSFTVTANPNAEARTGHLTVLGQTIAITQMNRVTVPPLAPPTLTGGISPAGGVFQMSFTAPTGLGFSGLSSPNLGLAVTNWTVAGAAVETPPAPANTSSPVPP